jgi:hypothetical protein
MESRLFKAVLEDANSDVARGFTKDLVALTSLNPSARDACVAAWRDFMSPRTQFQTRQLISNVASAHRGDIPSVQRALGVLHFLLRALLSDDVPEQDHQKWAADFDSLPGVTPEQGAAFRTTLDQLLALLPEVQQLDREERTADGVTPRFRSLGITVEARAVRLSRYRWGMPVGEYEPNIIGAKYVASVHVGIDEGFPEDFYFHVDENDIDRILDSFLAAKKEIAALRRFVETTRPE